MASIWASWGLDVLIFVYIWTDWIKQTHTLYIFVCVCVSVCVDRLPRWLSRKESTCQCRRRRKHGFDPWVRKIHWRRKWQAIPVFLPRKSHGQRVPEGYSLWAHKESDMTEWLSMHMCVNIYKLYSQWVCRESDMTQWLTSNIHIIL